MKYLALLIVLISLSGCKLYMDSEYRELATQSAMLSEKFATDPCMTCEQKQEALELQAEWWKEFIK